MCEGLKLLNTTLGFRGMFATFMSATWYFARACARVLGIFYAWPWAVGLAFSAGTAAAVTGGFSHCSLAVRRFLAASRLPHGFADHTEKKAIPGGSCCPIGTVEARANQEKTHFCALLLPGFYSNNLQHAALQFTLSNLNMMLQCVAIGIAGSYMSENLNKP